MHQQSYDPPQMLHAPADSLRSALLSCLHFLLMTIKNIMTTMLSSVQQAGLTEYLIILTIAIGCLLCLWSGRLLRRAIREDEEMSLLEEEMGLDNARFLDDCELGRSRIPVAVVFSTHSKPSSSYRPITLLDFDEEGASNSKK